MTLPGVDGRELRLDEVGSGWCGTEKEYVGCSENFSGIYLLLDGLLKYL
jgi:hypothetical protein